MNSNEFSTTFKQQLNRNMIYIIVEADKPE